MIVIKNTTRSMEARFAQILCNDYTKTFSDKIDGEDEEWSDGVATLHLQIYNSVVYKKNSALKTQKRKRTLEVDSDDEEIQAQETENILSEKWDEYGCVEYAPELPLTETSECQEEKRLKLKELFTSEKKDLTEVSKLMNDTYYSQRALLTESVRNLNDIIIDYPFLTNYQCFIDHSSRLLGKNVSETWINSFDKKAKTIRLYFTIPLNIKEDKGQEGKKEKHQKFKELLDESKEAAHINKDKIAKSQVVFPLLVTYFNETMNCLFKIVQKDDKPLSDHIDSEYPLLIIKGKSLYDQNSKCTVFISKDIQISCTDSLQGILIVFLAYYVFGLKYNTEIEKTLEFIQRFFLKINPKTGCKRKNKNKKREKNYDTSVFNLAKKLSDFSNDFKID